MTRCSVKCSLEWLKKKKCVLHSVSPWCNEFSVGVGFFSVVKSWLFIEWHLWGWKEPEIACGSKASPYWKRQRNDSFSSQSKWYRFVQKPRSSNIHASANKCYKRFILKNLKLIQKQKEIIQRTVYPPHIFNTF